LKKNID